MGSFWLAWGTGGDRPRVQCEIRARDPRAHILWFDGPRSIEEIAPLFSEGFEGVALCADRGSEAEILDVIRGAAATHGTRVVACTSDLDPAWIARLFHAGASEVVSSHDDVGGRSAQTEGDCIQGSSHREGGDGPAPDATCGPGEQRTHERFARNAAGGACDSALRAQDGSERTLVGQPSGLDDLDEPDSMALQPSGPCVRPSIACDGSDAASTACARRAPQGASSGSVPRQPGDADRSDGSGRRAPVVCVLSGTGGSGVTTIATSLACCASHFGLRAALLDLDLMFGNAFEMLGVESPHDLGMLVDPVSAGRMTEADIVRASMRVAPGLTLWGPVAEPEQAELLTRPVEALLDVLRSESDIIVVDTSRTWTEAVASAVSRCDRCLLVCDQTVGSASLLERAVNMVARIGVPRTRMVCVVNRFGQRGCTEEIAMRLEMAASLSAKARISDGGSSLSAMLAFGQAGEAVLAQDAFGRSMRAFSRGLLRELGCPLGADAVDERTARSDRPRLRLPWKNLDGAV